MGQIYAFSVERRKGTNHEFGISRVKAKNETLITKKSGDCLPE